MFSKAIRPLPPLSPINHLKVINPVLILLYSFRSIRIIRAFLVEEAKIVKRVIKSQAVGKTAKK